MPISTSPETHVHGRRFEGYRPIARLFHWLTVCLLAIQFPVGVYMVYRGPGQNVWDATTNTLYAGHKLVGVIVLMLIIARLAYRFGVGAPAPAATLAAWQKAVSALNHWGMYLLLIVVPVLGYLAICYFPAVNIFGPVSLPAIVAPDRALYDRVIVWHKIGAGVLAALIALHVVAALYHHLLRRDEVLSRMLPSLRRVDLLHDQDYKVHS
jgi:cytochrome b561